MSGYIGSRASVVSSGAERKQIVNVTTTTTTISGVSYTPGFVDVFHNGIRLVQGTDFTATNGSSITLTNAAENGDQIVVKTSSTFSPADAVSKGGDTMTGDLTTSGKFQSATFSDGTTTIGSGYVVNGSAKATCAYDQVSVEIDESSNVSSVTDLATGQSTVNLTNSMNVADAAVVGSAFSVQNWAVATGSGTYNFNTRSSSSVFVDSSGVYTARFGDLA